MQVYIPSLGWPALAPYTRVYTTLAAFSYCAFLCVDTFADNLATFLPVGGRVGAGDQTMDDIVNLGENSQFQSTRVSADPDCELPCDFVEDREKSPPAAGPPRGGSHVRGMTHNRRYASTSSHTEAALSHKVRGPNWTEAEMLVLIGQKRIEWDGRHNCN